MPTYEYACKACEHNFDIVQSFSEDALTTCPECDQEALRKVYNAAGIIFKGDGWHIKDYGSSSSSAAAASGSTNGDGGGSDTSTTSSTSSKPASKAATSGAGSTGSDAAAKPAAG